MAALDTGENPPDEERGPGTGRAPATVIKEDGRTYASSEQNVKPHERETLTAQAGFDYSALPTEIRDEAKIAADEIRGLMRRSIVDVGAALARIKDRLPHGQFGKWLSAEFGLTERTAQNYMAAAALASEYETVSDLRPKTLYLLASPSTPEPIRREVIARFDAGEPIPDRTIKEMIGKAKVRQRQEQPRQPASRARAEAVAAFSALLHEQLADALDDLTRMLRDERSRIAEMPMQKRVVLARGYLNALGVTLDDLRPVGGKADDKPAPAPKPPASEAPVTDNTEKIAASPAAPALSGDPLAMLQTRYAELGDRAGARDWVLRRLAQGDMPVPDDASEGADFVRSLIAVPAAIQNRFRAGIIETPGA
jgi:hypothetical protein